MWLLWLWLWLRNAFEVNYYVCCIVASIGARRRFQTDDDLFCDLHTLEAYILRVVTNCSVTDERVSPNPCSFGSIGSLSATIVW
jgi:hypothetical protein